MPARNTSLPTKSRQSILFPLATLSLFFAVTPSALCQSTVSGDLTSPVTGESWLTHLQRPFNETSMGKTGELGPPPNLDGDGQSQWRPGLSLRGPREPVRLTGYDLYRYDCRGCHGEQGIGAPPEIRSLINPVRATSVVLVSARLKSTGMELSHAQVSQMATQARAALVHRLHDGGENMPAFGYLREPEERSLTGYLEQLANVPGARQSTVQETPLRIGELIAKSTCHVCHDATGANPTPEQILQGAIPPLSTLTTRTSEAEFIRKVTHGSPIRMGDPAMLHRGRMPVFYYLTEDEAAALYSYFTLYPPVSGQDTAVSTAQSQALMALVSATDSFPTNSRAVTEDVDGKSVVLMIVLGAIIALLIMAGCGITVREFRRLCSENNGEGSAPQATRSVEEEAAYSR